MRPQISMRGQKARLALCKEVRPIRAFRAVPLRTRPHDDVRHKTKPGAAGDAGVGMLISLKRRSGERDIATPAQFPNNLEAVARALGGEVCGREVL